jgi:flagellar hook-length control protein FliK
MLNEVETISSENGMHVEKSPERSQHDEGLLGMVIQPEREISFLMGDMVLKGENIAEVSGKPDQNSIGNKEKQFIPTPTGKDLLQGYFPGNEEDKNKSAIASEVEIKSGGSKSTPGDRLNISIQAEESQLNAWPKELNKNNIQIQNLKEYTGKADKEADGQKQPVEVRAQLLKGMNAELSKLLKDLETTGKNSEAQIKHAQSIKDVEKTAITDTILREGTALRANVEESKVINRNHLFTDDTSKQGELSKKEVLLKISTENREKEQDSELLKRDNTSDKKTSQSDNGPINHKEVGLKVKTSANESLVSKVAITDSQSKGHGITYPKNGSEEKSFEEILFTKENKPSSNNSRAGALNQIVEKAALNLKDGKSHARLELKPEFLGSVRMKITTENHLVRVRILTELPIVKEMIENNISQLKADLQSHGLSIDKLDVSVANDSQQHGKGFEKAGLLSEKETSDVSGNAADVPEETATVNLLKEEASEDGLDFFA